MGSALSSPHSPADEDNCQNQTEKLSVQGKVQKLDGSVVAGAGIIAVDVDIRSEQELGRAKTTPTGEYKIFYTSKQFSRIEKDSADLRVRVYKDANCNSDIEATSNILFNAPPAATIDIVIGGDTLIGPSEFSFLSALINPLLGNLAPSNLVEDDVHKDLSFLAGETGEELVKVEFFATAHRHQQSTNVLAEVFYGLFRQNISTNLDDLLMEGEDVLMKALEESIHENIISQFSANQINTYISALHKLGVKSTIETPDGESTPIGDVLSTIIDKPELFMEIFSEFEGTTESFWQNLESKPEFKGKVDNLQLSVQLGIATLSHAPLVKELLAQQNFGQIKSLGDLATLSVKNWTDIIQKPGVGTPGMVPGNDTTEKIQNYAKGISKLIENTFPSKFVASRLLDQDDDIIYGPLPGKKDLNIFFAKNPDFSFTTQRLVNFLDSKPGSLEGVQDRELLKDNMSTMQRMYRISGQYTNMRALINGGVTASRQIANMGETIFTAKFQTSLGSTGAAAKIYDNALHAHAVATNLLGNLGNPGQIVGTGRWTDSGRIISTLNPRETGIPDWSTLFNSLDMCSCSECRSTEGPAAYLVDILHFLKGRLLVESVVRDKKTGDIIDTRFRKRLNPETNKLEDMSAKDVLFDRRPDLGDIELSCENTNTPIPYIDLTNEVLENAVLPPPKFQKFTLPTESAAKLDAHDIEDLRNLFNPPLSNLAEITVVRVGQHWSIDEAAYSYTIRKDGTTISAVARSLQTKGTARERVASSQYINIEAYRILLKQVYPLNLPFDLWTMTARTYLSHVGVMRYQLMEIFFSERRSTNLAEISIVEEFLGLTMFEARLVTGEITSQEGSPAPGPWNLWGFSKENLDPSSSIPDPADKSKTINSGLWRTVLTGRLDVFLQQSALKHKELLNIIQVGHIFGGEVKVEILPHEGELPDTCDPSRLRIRGLGQNALQRLNQFIRLSRKLDGWGVLDLARVFDALGFPNQPEDMRQFLVQVSHIRRLMKALDLPLDLVLAFWTTLSTKAYHDYENSSEDQKPESLYSQVFRNPTIDSKSENQFPVDPTQLTGKLSETTLPIAAALGISPIDFGFFLTNGNVVVGDGISLDNLSRLFRHTILARTLSVAIQDYLPLLELVSADPFQNTTETVLFVERVQNVQDSGFSWVELNYLLRHSFSVESGINPTDEALSFVLDDIRSGLRSIAIGNTFDTETVDDNGDITKKKLALLNWDATIISQAIGCLDQTASFAVSLSTPPNIAFPESLQGKVSYDANKAMLMFSRVMTTEERAQLKGISSASSELAAAVDSLFQIPRTFFARNMRTFSIQTFSVDLASLPPGVKIPTSMRKKIYFDRATSRLYSQGALTGSEQQTLLTLSTNTDYVNAVNNLFDAANNISPIPGDEFVTEEDVSVWFDSLVDVTGTPITPSMRFQTLLQKLLPYVREKLSNHFTRQKIGQSINSNSEIVENLLLKWLKFSSSPINDVFRSSLFVESSENSAISRISFPDQFSAMTLLTKVGLIISKLKLTTKQLGWIFRDRTSGDPSAGWLDLNQLPLVPLDSGILNFVAWERLYSLTRLRDTLIGGEKLLEQIFTIARSPSGTVNSIIDLLAKDLKIQPDDLNFIVGPQGFNLSFPLAYQDEIAITRILRADGLFRKIGCTPATAKLISSPDIGEQEARAVKQAVKSKYDQPSWDTIAPSLNNILRDAQRSALVTYLLAHPKPEASSQWRTANDLYAYFLIDVEMGPCQKTSRIKQAICSVQLFVQRCLLNLETEVKANEESDSHWQQWAWMKSFRLAGANKQVFETPENFLESSVRDDKTEFFKEFELEMQQGDLDNTMAETVVLNYLEKLDSVSRLEVVSYYHQEEHDGSANKAVDIIHIFARTKSKPQQYYYCQRVDGSYWTGWERMGVDIQGDHLIPVIWNRRLYLFWAVFTAKQEQRAITMPAPNQTVKAGNTFWEIKLAWTERKRGKWVPKVISDAYMICPKSSTRFEEEDMKVSPGRTLISFKAAPNPDSGELWIRALIPQPLAYFYFNGVRGQPQVKRPRIIYARPRFIFPDSPLYTIRPPAGCVINNMGFIESDSSDGKVWIRTDKVEKLALLNKTPGYQFHLVVAHQDLLFQAQRPFWFQHDEKSYFIEQEETEFIFPNILLPFGPLINPSLLDGRLAAPYYDTAVFKPRPDVIPRPDISGPLKFSPTFEYTSDLNATLKTNIQTSIAVPALNDNVDFGMASAIVPKLNYRDLVMDFSAIQKIDTSMLRITSKSLKIPFTLYKFSNFYHPYVSELIKVLNKDGIDGLYQRPLQQLKRDTFVAEYAPQSFVNQAERPIEMLDFDDNIFSVYNWELFFHIPVTIAERLSKNQRFQEAQKWFHYVFDPTDTSSLSVPQRYWKTKKLFEVSDEEYTKQTIKNILNFLAKGGDRAQRANLSRDEKKYLDLLEMNVARWRDDPFSPFVVARGRVTAFQKSVVMKYLDNLIAWGDYLFRGDTIELINEATQIYILAAEILGPRPLEMTPGVSPQVQTYNSLEPRIDAYGNALASIEDLVPASVFRRRFVIRKRPQPQATPPSMTYFCVPKNSKLLSYWDTVSDRLFKIRHCMNLMGIVRELPLFEPPIDPALLIRAAASGVDLSSAVGDTNAPLPRHRYIYLSSKATEICQELKSLGNAILATLEKKDAGEMALLNSTQSMKLLDAVREVKKQQVVDTLLAIDVLNKSKEVVTEKWKFYKDTPLMNIPEITHMGMEGAALLLNLLDSGAQPVAGVLNLIPDAKLGAPTSIGFTIGGTNAGKSSSKFGKFLEKSGIFASRGGGMVATMASHMRRKDQDDLQYNLADKELKQIGSQIESANVRNAIAQKDLDNHDVQAQHAKDTNEFLHSKYTNVQLYDWMLSQLATVYFQTYKLVFDAAKRAERSFSYELGVDRPNLVSIDYWDSMKKGLTAGERLFCDIKRMDMAYLDQDLREYEITKSVSLAQLDPVALIQLRSTGSCFFNIPEEIFDLDFPGHYMRRIKAVTVTIPCISGPYTSISSTLSLLRASIRKSNTLFGGKYVRQDNDIRFSDIYGQFQSIVTSTGNNDSGMFETNLRDERYLPFERSGVISSWKMELPMAFKQYDYDTISDVILHIRYTAREGGAALGALASAALKAKALDAIATAEGNNGLSRLFDIPREFPDLWYKFLKGTVIPPSSDEESLPTTTQIATFPLSNIRFPYLFSGASSINITKADLFVRIKTEFISSHSPDTLTITLSDSSTAPGDPLVFSEWRSGDTDAAKGKVFRATKILGRPVGNYYLKGSLNDGADVIDSDAVSQFLLVAHYTVKWT